MKQYTCPSVVRSGKEPECLPLRRVRVEQRSDDGFDEDWLQALIFSNPELIPVDEVERIFSHLIPVCREMGTGAGPIDNVFINREGLITIVECKLFRNPEARRTVIAQVLDYAKELTRWNYKDFEAAALRARNDGSTSLYSIANPAGQEPEVTEEALVDTVTTDLRRGRFLLLILGDGIRSDMESMSEFLQKHATLNFALALIELAVYKLPDGYDHELLVTPRVLARTVEIPRAVIRVEGKTVVAEEPEVRAAASQSGYTRPSSLTEQEFFAKIEEIKPGVAEKLRAFLQEVSEQGVEIECRISTLNLIYYGGRGRANLGMINLHGQIDTGRVPRGMAYLEGLQALVPESAIRSGKMPAILMGKDLPDVELLLARKDDWLELIRLAVFRLDAEEE